MSPLVGEEHRRFWSNIRSTTAPPVHLSKGWTYPTWQSSVIAPSLFGAIGAWLDARLAQLRWHLALHRRVRALGSEPRTVLLKVLDTLESPRYPLAQTAVRGTATTLGFRDPAAWRGLSRVMKENTGKAENVFRHAEACRRLVEAVGSTMTNLDQNLTVELAYVGFVCGRDPRPKMAGSA